MTSDETNTGGRERPDPRDDPFACSICGVYIGQFSGDYCDGCAREIGVKPPLRRCVECGQRGPEEAMEAIDVSREDEYYPRFIYVCCGCYSPSSDTDSDQDVRTDGGTDTGGSYRFESQGAINIADFLDSYDDHFVLMEERGADPVELVCDHIEVARKHGALERSLRPDSDSHD